jgi:tetratricopeptide (TPR) repeat protein
MTMRAFWLVMATVGMTMVALPARGDELAPADAAQVDQALTERVDRVVAELWAVNDEYFHCGRYEDSIRVSESIIVLDPGFIEAYANAAWLCWSMGQDDRAMSFYCRCIAANPTHWESYFELGMYYSQHRRDAEAATQLAEAVRYGAPVIVQRAYGHSLRRAGRLREALAVFQKVLADNPGDAVALRQASSLTEELSQPCPTTKKSPPT